MTDDANGQKGKTTMTDHSAGARVLADTLANGGSTYIGGVFNPFLPGTGYAVAYADGVTLNIRGATPGVVEDVLAALARDRDTRYVGTWLDGGILYLDAVRYFSAGQAQAAVHFAIEQGQRTLYDFALCEALRPGQVAFDQ